MKLGTIRKIDDTVGQLPQPEFLNGDEAIVAPRVAVAPIAAGSQQLSVDVAVTFAIMRS